ncbi:hypothetical protein AWB68_08774 [Caballeronia choica]|uniref:Uncharacterized protein n=1 Tax=Caballeronia choica TaxID=326476 RepID=A0A158L636_9BURK|nr:hypothetical protein AWB68_08774 [Caballeronia choica]
MVTKYGLPSDPTVMPIDLSGLSAACAPDRVRLQPRASAMLANATFCLNIFLSPGWSVGFGGNKRTCMFPYAVAQVKR